MKTKYTETIRLYLDKIIAQEYFHKWFLEQPILDRPDILREFKAIVEADFEINALTNENSIEFANQLNAFEDKTLSLNLTKQLALLEIEKADKKIKEIENSFEKRREDLLFDMQHNRGDIDKLKEYALKLIAAEKQIEIYKPENWKEVLGML